MDVRDVAAGCIAAAEKGRTGECYILSEPALRDSRGTWHGTRIWRRQEITHIAELDGKGGSAPAGMDREETAQ